MCLPFIYLSDGFPHTLPCLCALYSARFFWVTSPKILLLSVLTTQISCSLPRLLVNLNSCLSFSAISFYLKQQHCSKPAHPYTDALGAAVGQAGGWEGQNKQEVGLGKHS